MRQRLVLEFPSTVPRDAVGRILAAAGEHGGVGRLEPVRVDPEAIHDGMMADEVRVSWPVCVVDGCRDRRIGSESTCFDHTPDDLGVMPAECACEPASEYGDDGWMCGPHTAAWSDLDQ